MASNNVIFGVNGPVVTVYGATDFSMLEMVYVGEKHLVGEVIAISEKYTTIQVYEETTGLMPGEAVEPTGMPMSVTLGPGIISNIFDGIQRPLRAIEANSGAFIERGSSAEILDTQRKWEVHITAAVGDCLVGGNIYAESAETEMIVHRIMLPPNMSGEIIKIVDDGFYTVNDTIAELKDSGGVIHKLTLVQKWPIRVPRPVSERLDVTLPLVTGQRIIDSMLPIAKGGCAAIPGGFGTGKTMTQHQLAKWCDADIIVYIGCGERGNEMSQVLEEFSELIDPRSGRPLTDRTVLIANTSNMPVAAREASIYTGISLAEYYRDMGYHVAVMADSTSRWAEALREISGRLEEMPAEEGFPAYLPSRLSEFYERAGYMKTLNGKEGSITVIGAVSPQGADFSEPVTQNTKRFTRCFWALDKSIAYARHYPAINWITSYSEYVNDLAPWYEKNAGEDFISCRERINGILQEENKLMEIVKLIGADLLPDDQKLVIEIAKVIRVGFLQQNAHHKDDTFVPMQKQLKMMRVILHLYNRAKQTVLDAIPVARISETGLFDKVSRIKYDVPNDRIDEIDDYFGYIDDAFAKITAK